jgi:hypothetical protein
MTGSEVGLFKDKAEIAHKMDFDKAAFVASSRDSGCVD